MIIDFDKVLERLGEFKRYQIYHYVLLGIASVPVGMHTLANVFLAATPSHWCTDPQIANFSGQEHRGAAPSDGSRDRIHNACIVFDGLASSRNGSLDFVTKDPGQTACRGWSFDRNVYESTITTEWNLVCSEAWKPVMAQSLFMTGFLLGAIIFGALSDRIGRKLSWYIGLISVVISGCLAAFMPDYWSHVIARLVSGAAGAGYYTVGFVLSLETIGKAYRVKTGIMYQGFFALGYMLLAAMAYFIRDYVWLQLAVSITPAACLSYYCFIGESPRWLITQGRLAQARHELRRIARMNKSDYVDDVLEKEADYLVKCNDPHTKKKFIEKTTQDRTYSVVDLVKTPNLRKTSFNLFFNWFVNSLVYYGLSQGISELSGSVYWNLFIAGVMEISALAICVFALERVGRRWPIAICMIVGGLACLAFVPLPQEMDIARTILSMIGRFCISGSFGIVYVFSAELFPTVLRNTGIGTGSMHARVGGLIAPFVTELGRLFWKPLPMIVFGCASLLAGVLALLLPETFNQHLPDTIEDAENFGKTRPSVFNSLCRRGKTTNGPTEDPIPLEMPPSQDHTGTPGVTHALSVPLSQDHTDTPPLHTLCQCHPLKTIQARRRYTRSVSATLSRPYRHAAVTHALSVPLSQDHTGTPGVTHALSVPPSQDHTGKAGVTHALSVPPSQDHTGTPGVTHALSVPPSQYHTGTAGVTHALSVPLSQDHTGTAGVTHALSVPPSQDHTGTAGVTHALSVPLSQDHTGTPPLHRLCQCHSLKTIQARRALHTLCQGHSLKTIQARRRYTRSVSATLSRPYRHAAATHALSVPLSQDHTGTPGVTHALSVPLSQDHTGTPPLHTLCQCHPLKTIQARRRYTRSVSATLSRPYRHAGRYTRSVSATLSRPCRHAGRYTRSVSATLSGPYRRAGATHALSVPLSQDHTGAPPLHTLCQCHSLKTIQARHRYTRSVSATLSRPYRHAAITHALSMPLSQDHTGAPPLSKLCQCHPLKTIQARRALHTLCQCHSLKTIQARRRYTRSVSATLSRPYRHAAITHALSVPFSQDHTGAPTLHTLCQCHSLKTIQVCRALHTFYQCHPLKTIQARRALHTLCQCHSLKTIQARRRYTRSVSATLSRPYRHAAITHALSVPFSQDHTGAPTLHTLCQCHSLKTIQARRRYTRSVSATLSRPYRHAAATHALSVPPSQDHTGSPALHTFCQCHPLKTIHARRHYTRSVSANLSRPYRRAAATHALSVPHISLFVMTRSTFLHAFTTTFVQQHSSTSEPPSSVIIPPMYT
ncbi:Organic cation transporter protein [Lamellibrachia satsuma]|nr:Organic cation transporter protein [Lamellibrachia satsuma]